MTNFADFFAVFLAEVTRFFIDELYHTSGGLRSPNPDNR
jgi:hypothetical protein